MTNAEWWNRVAASRTESDSHTIMPAWTLRREGHEAALALRRIADIGTEVVLLVVGDWLRTRLFRVARRGRTRQGDR
jgi:hypothetical protein